jgi:hypothetical protein
VHVHKGPILPLVRDLQQLLRGVHNNWPRSSSSPSRTTCMFVFAPDVHAPSAITPACPCNSAAACGAYAGDQDDRASTQITHALASSPAGSKQAVRSSLLYPTECPRVGHYWFVRFPVNAHGSAAASPTHHRRTNGGNRSARVPSLQRRWVQSVRAALAGAVADQRGWVCLT